MAKEAKEMVAVRLDPADRRKAKVIADRLGVSESDLLRYAIKVALEDFSPLTDGAKEGAELFEAFLQHGPEKARWLDLDTDKLDRILHDDLQNEDLRVGREDMRIAMGASGGTGYHDWLMKYISGELKPWVRELPTSTYLHQKYVEPLRIEAQIEEHLENERRESQ